MFAKAKLIIFGVVLGMTAILLHFALRNINREGDVDLVPFSEFSTHVTDGSIDLVRIEGMTAFGRMDAGKWISTRLPEDHGEFVDQLSKDNIVVEVVGGEPPSWLATFTTGLPAFLLMGFWIWAIVTTRRASKLARQQPEGSAPNKPDNPTD